MQRVGPERSSLASAATGAPKLLDRVRQTIRAKHYPRSTAENRQFVDSAKPAISRAAETSQFYFVPSFVRKSVCSFVRQLRGPHFSTWA